MKVTLFGIDVDNYSLAETVDIVANHATERKAPAYVVTPNANHIVRLRKDLAFQAVYRQALLSVADGVPLLWVAKSQGTPLKGRVNGTDLFEQTCAAAADRGLSVFFLGGRPEAADRAAAILQERHSTLKVAGTYCPPYGFEANPAEVATIDRVIKAAQPDILFVGLGAPKQEFWMAEHCQALGVPISLGIGVSFEFVAGMVNRSPLWMQRIGLEWLHRLWMEPRRLLSRTLVFLAVFLGLWATQIVRNVLGLDRRFTSDH
jgi:N-acetylglucosaminyldiphosphoundecaprenol N-acetyl-beta-D-mannosaminyltransferase